MGRTRGLYHEDFPVDSWVRVADRPTLEKFIAEWKGHNPLDPAQLHFAGQRAEIKSVGFYHGGDELYEP
jgi:hypothetical protein